MSYVCRVEVDESACGHHVKMALPRAKEFDGADGGAWHTLRHVAKLMVDRKVGAAVRPRSVLERERGGLARR